MPRHTIGALIRERRLASRRSQLDLAIDAGVSTRHLGFVERGRARPSPELVELLAARLDVPLRERNQWLLAAGYAPVHGESALTSPTLAPVSASLQRLLDVHQPNPGVVIDAAWNVRLTNRSAIALAEGIPDHARGTPTNVFRICLHPDGLAARTTNLEDWSRYLLAQLDAAIARTRHPDLVALAAEIETWPGLPSRTTWRTPPRSTGADPLVTWNLVHRGRSMSLFTTLAVLGAPLDVTLAELAVELFYPADEPTAIVLADLALES